MRTLLVAGLLLLALVGIAHAQATGYTVMTGVVANETEYVNESGGWIEYSFRAFDLHLAGLACGMFARNSASATWVNVGEYSIPQIAAATGGATIAVYYMRSPGCSVKAVVAPGDRVKFDVHSSYDLDAYGQFINTQRVDLGASTYGTSSDNGIHVTDWLSRAVPAP